MVGKRIEYAIIVLPEINLERRIYNSWEIVLIGYKTHIKPGESQRTSRTRYCILLVVWLLGVEFMTNLGSYSDLSYSDPKKLRSPTYAYFLTLTNKSAVQIESLEKLSASGKSIQSRLHKHTIYYLHSWKHMHPTTNDLKLLSKAYMIVCSYTYSPTVLWLLIMQYLPTLHHLNMNILFL